MLRSGFVVLLAGSLAAAPSVADEIEVQPGQWRYEVAANMGGLPITEMGVDCVTPPEARRSLSQTAAALGNACTIKSSRAIKDGYAFTLTCDGALKGEVDGEVVTDGERAALSGTGWAGAPENAVVITGSAERVGETCNG